MRALFHMNCTFLSQNVYHSHFMMYMNRGLLSAKPSWLHFPNYFIYNELFLYCSLSSSLCVMFHAICSECTSRASAQFREAHRSTNTSPGVLFWDKSSARHKQASKGDGHKHACALSLSCFHPCKHFKELSGDNAVPWEKQSAFVRFPSHRVPFIRDLQWMQMIYFALFFNTVCMNQEI
jgi:hypothetical protein